MAEFTIPVRDAALKQEIEDCFAECYANPDNLTGEQLVVLHVSNYIRGILNDCREKDAVDTAKQAVSKEESLD